MLKILSEAERGIVFRLGKFHRVAGPGIVFLIPLIDLIYVVNLDQTVPEWRGVSAEEVKKMVEFLVKHYPDIPRSLTVKEIRQAMQKDE